MESSEAFDDSAEGGEGQERGTKRSKLHSDGTDHTIEPDAVNELRGEVKEVRGEMRDIRDLIQKIDEKLESLAEVKGEIVVLVAGKKKK